MSRAQRRSFAGGSTPAVAALRLQPPPELQIENRGMRHILKGRCCIVQPTSSAVGMHRRADRYRSIAIVKGYRTVKILWPTDDCSKSSRLYKWECMAIFSHFWRNLLAYSTVVLYENLPFNTHHTVGRTIVVVIGFVH